MSIKLIVGLGNPGLEYDNTRHNVGFEAINQLCKLLDVELDNHKFDGEYAKIKINNETFIIAKPLTYMNLSGKFVAKLVNFYKIEFENIVIIQDDLDLPLGTVKFRTNGSAGGHNGIKNIIDLLGTTEFNRIKIGIGRPNGTANVKNYVLNKLNQKETIIINSEAKLVANTLFNWSKETFVKLASTFSNLNMEKQ